MVQNGRRVLTACGRVIRGWAAEKRWWKAITVLGSDAVDLIGMTGTSSLLCIILFHYSKRQLVRDACRLRKLISHIAKSLTGFENPQMR